MVSALVVSTAGAAAGGGGRGRGGLAFADGTWVGTITQAASLDVSEAQSQQGGGGSFDLRVAGGAVTRGNFTFTVVQNLSAPEGTGVGTLTGHGIITGDAGSPTIETEAAALEGTITIRGISFPITMGFPGGVGNLTMTRATCDVVYGTLEPIARATAEASGIGVNALVYDFVATRSPTEEGELDEAFLEQLNLLMEGMNELTQLIDGGGTFVETSLSKLLEQAEALERAISHSPRCGLGRESMRRGQLLELPMQRLLEAILRNPDSIAGIQVRSLIEAAIRTGTIARGANRGLAQGLRTLLGTKLDAAIASDDIVTIGNLGAAAESMGWDDEARRAQRAVGR
jgi:hypothetical protein